jgi:TolB-like protein/Tfp pilus assembly protein PilF/predicted Ser/Thr protein kinase
LIGRTLTHYRIVESLGAGGMGAVYRAHDDRLGRDVALKLLLPECCPGEADRERVRTEARTLARLNHTGIAALFDIDREGDADFLVMEFVPGEPLDRRIAAGPLAEGEVLALGIQIAEALAAAHEEGVVHRDLKPGNIVVTPRGQIKLLDFGIATLIRSGATRDATTTTGSVPSAGTLAYLSPEQVLGRPAGPASDLYALGVVLYEMATGRRPHGDEPAPALLYAIAHTTPPPPSTVRPDLSPALDALLRRLLEKDPARRPASAAEAAEALRDCVRSPDGAAAGGLLLARSVAVLPLENLSGDPAQDFFADGMTDAVIGQLARIRALRVISRTSVMRYKGGGRRLPEIARELAVGHVVEGTVARSAERVRVSVRLIDAAADQQVWAETVERGAGDVLALQADLARAIAEGIRVRLTPGEAASLAGARPVDPLAYESYLRGRYHWARRRAEDMRRSIELYQATIQRDSRYAPAWSGLADAWAILTEQNEVPVAEGAEQARSAALRALELDPELAEAHTSIAFLRFFFDWGWAGAREAFERAIAIDPGYATGHQWYAEFLSSQAEHEAAIAAARRARELDPLSTVMRTTLAETFYFSRRHDEAIAELERAIELDPTYAPAHSDLGRVLTQVGRHDQALAAYRRVAKLRRIPPLRVPGYGHALAAAGRADEARQIAAHLEAAAGQGPRVEHAIAVIHVALGDPARALEWLERARDRRDWAMVWLAVHPRLDPLRGEPRFQALLGELRLGR